MTAGSTWVDASVNPINNHGPPPALCFVNCGQGDIIWADGVAASDWAPLAIFTPTLPIEGDVCMSFDSLALFFEDPCDVVYSPDTIDQIMCMLRC